MPQPASNRTKNKKRPAGSELSLEQVLEIIRRLDSAARSRVAQALVESEVDARFEHLILNLASRPPVDEISDIDIQAEVDAVRRAHVR